MLYSKIFEYLHKHIKLLIVVFIAVLGLYSLFYAYGHGIIDASNPILINSKISYTHLSDAVPTTIPRQIRQGSHFVRSGDYEVVAMYDDGRVYSFYIKVGHFFKTTRLNFTKKSIAATNQIAANVKPFVLPKDDQIISIGNVSFEHKTNDPIGIRNKLINTGILSGDSLYSYYTGGRLLDILPSENGHEVFLVEKLDPAMISNSLKHTPIISNQSTIISSADRSTFAVYDSIDKTIYSFKDTSAIPVKISLKQNPAIGEELPLIATGNSKIVVLYGEDYQMVGDGVRPSGRTSSYKVEIYDLSGKILMNARLSRSELIRSVTIQPSGSNITVLSDSNLFVYRFDKSHLTRIFGASQNSISDIGWIDDSTVYYLYDTTSLQAISIGNFSTSYPLFYNKNLSLSSAHSDNGIVYINGYYKSDPSQTAYAFSVDPAKTISQKQLIYLEKFPYETDYFKLGVSNDNVYIYPKRTFYADQISRQSILDEANQYIQKLLPGVTANTTYFP